MERKVPWQVGEEGGEVTCQGREYVKRRIEPTAAEPYLLCPRLKVLQSAVSVNTPSGRRMPKCWLIGLPVHIRLLNGDLGLFVQLVLLDESNAHPPALPCAKHLAELFKGELL